MFNIFKRKKDPKCPIPECGVETRFSGGAGAEYCGTEHRLEGYKRNQRKTAERRRRTMGMKKYNKS